MALVACPHCNAHVKSIDKQCPHCGLALRRSDGTVALAAGAIALGLVAASSCEKEETAFLPPYGVPDVSSQASSGVGGQAGSEVGGQAGSDEGGAGGNGGAGGM